MLLEIVNFVHFLGLAFGLGGATIATVISRKAEKDKDIARVSMKIIPSIVKFIWIGLILLVLSGIALSFLIPWELDRQLLIIKHILVFWIVVIGAITGFSFKKMSRLAPIGREKPKPQFLRIKKVVKILSMINLILWYAITIMSAFV